MSETKPGTPAAALGGGDGARTREIPRERYPQRGGDSYARSSGPYDRGGGGGYDRGYDRGAPYSSSYDRPSYDRGGYGGGGGGGGYSDPRGGGGGGYGGGGYDRGYDSRYGG